MAQSDLYGNRKIVPKIDFSYQKPQNFVLAPVTSPVGESGGIMVQRYDQSDYTIDEAKITQQETDSILKVLSKFVF